MNLTLSDRSTSRNVNEFEKKPRPSKGTYVGVIEAF